MAKSLSDKYLSCNLLPFCFRLCRAVSGDGMVGAETTGNNRTQSGYKIGVKFFYNNGLQICVRDSSEDE